ncbi:hypothetical protein GO495_25260 [Chitinophaga oryziterrae]|uniref:Uncharacterized protein n=1 Tax=Chitinophaga oryziterrae TaxID=1031224 RepID=A0A6N8JHS8_9BACT|nr:hypothetical protein [Chitinophaga oryziterrae]MVT43929.1 hypothetical protein [Chitinophaga oryziterrae]
MGKPIIISGDGAVPVISVSPVVLAAPGRSEDPAWSVACTRLNSLGKIESK